jgi:hypothetical protein
MGQRVVSPILWRATITATTSCRTWPYDTTFYKQLDKSSAPAFFLDSLSDIMSQLSMKVLGFEAGAAFSEFKRLILQDGSSFALHQALADLFPGRFSAVSPAAVELHCTLDLLQDALWSSP